MIIRVVKLTFELDKVEEFISNFMAHKDEIRSVAGCHHLELWNDSSDSTVFFTYSHWTSEAHLNTYRHSELFKAVWSKTKPLFAAPPEAWSVKEIARGDQL